tara:strand:+ start:71 stop:265 length:195 start_codon:yes stop_codon:yes gene_type:complete
MHPEDEDDFRESWANAGSRPPRRTPQHFQFREAGVQRFNDVYDDDLDEDGVDRDSIDFNGYDKP